MFAKELLDLKWDNPAVRKEIYAMVNWRLDKGIVGFRMNVIINIKKKWLFLLLHRMAGMVWYLALK